MLFAGGVLLGCAALTVDVGQLYSERRQLQNGADAAALRPRASLLRSGGPARTPARTRLPSAPTAISNLSTMRTPRRLHAAFNTAFNATYDNGLCGRATTLAELCGPNGSLLDCPALPSCSRRTPPSRTSRCTTSPRPTVGQRILPTAFGRAVTGFSGARSPPVALVSRCDRRAGCAGQLHLGDRHDAPATSSITRVGDWRMQRHAADTIGGGVGAATTRRRSTELPGGSVYRLRRARPAPVARRRRRPRGAGRRLTRSSMLVQNPAWMAAPSRRPARRGKATHFRWLRCSDTTSEPV